MRMGEECSAESLKKLIFDGNSLDSAALHSLPKTVWPACRAQSRPEPACCDRFGELCPVQRDHEIGATSETNSKASTESQILDGK